MVAKISALFRHLCELAPIRHKMEKDEAQLLLEEIIGREVKNYDLYRRALTHRSYENVGQKGSNERLEFLGDSVLSCAVGHALFDLYPEEQEGTLTGIRSYIVNRNHLNDVAFKLGLDQIVMADESVDFKKSDILGNALEALVGAIYLDLGFDVACRFVRNRLIVSKNNLRVVSKKEEDYKTEFIILMQKHKIKFEFAHLDTHFERNKGMIHRCQLLVGEDNIPISTGVGTSKKITHQNAAKDALKLIEKQPHILKEWSR